MSETTKPLLVRLFTNGNFKVFREVIYVVGFIISLTLAWSNLTNAVSNNTGYIEVHTEQIEKMEDFKSNTEKDVATIKEGILWIKESLKK